MIYGHDVLRIFWPTDALKSAKQGVIVGWRNSETDIVVVAVLEDVEPRNVEHALQVGHLFRNCAHPMFKIFDLCGHSSMSVIGTTNGPVSSHFNLYNMNLSIQNGGLPRLIGLQSIPSGVQIILYQKPSPHYMQYMSLTSISLAIADKEAQDYTDETQAYLVEKMKLHSVIKRGAIAKELMVPKILDQINCSQELTHLMLRNLNLVARRLTRKMSVSERVIETANSAWMSILYRLTSFWNTWIWPATTQVFKLLLIGLRILAEMVLRIVEWRLTEESSALRDISVTAQQIDIRLQQFCYWPIQYTKLRSRRNDWKSVTDSHPEYIRFYNSLWLVANDVIIGMALGSFILDNADYLAYWSHQIMFDCTITGLRSMIEWLTQWPAGLKLNNELATFLADLVVWVIVYWSYLLQFIQPLLPNLIRTIGWASFAGATLPIALLSDLLDLLTMHVYAFYVASARIFYWQLMIIVSLFHLFRGKKNNVLRRRIDSCDYDLDQLLLGTILFTLLAFLLPTVLVFYLTFACSRMGMIMITAGLETALTFLNHFPLFALMLRLKDSKRLPGGICFHLCDTVAITAVTEGQSIADVSYLTVESVPLSLRQIFDQYFRLSTRLRKHYLAPSMVFRLLTGQFVPPIHRKSLYSLQYSMLPAHRPGIAETWDQLQKARKPEPQSWSPQLERLKTIGNGAALQSRHRRGVVSARQPNPDLGK